MGKGLRVLQICLIFQFFGLSQPFLSLGVGYERVSWQEAVWRNSGEIMSFQEFDAHMSSYWDHLTEAIYRAEGAEKAKVPFGILSVKCDSYHECKRICYNTVRNNYYRWVRDGRKGDYISFLASRYAPVGADNDPEGLNTHWEKNVRYFMGGK